VQPQFTSYDDVPYESHAFVQTQPDRLGTLARLFSLKSALPSRARMLEIGCASGGNLIPLAYRYPDAEFVGIDLSPRQIADGQQHVASLGLKNLKLIAMDLMDVDQAFGRFDYIVSHGVYSWIPPEAKKKLLAVSRANLAPDGVVYVSYNTNPGWRMRSMIRDMMRYHVSALRSPRDRAAQARSLLEFLKSSLTHDTSAYAKLLGEESRLLGKLSDDYLIHEHLEDDNEPVYFHEFVQRAAAADLQFLCEEDIRRSLPEVMFRSDVAQTLRKLTSDVVHIEQYSDFLMNRTFRQSLLVSAGRVPQRAVDAGIIRSMFVGSSIRPATGEPNILDDSRISYVAESGAAIHVSNKITKAAMDVLRKRSPETLPFRELYESARRVLGRDAAAKTASGPSDELLLANDLAQGFSVSVVSLHCESTPAKGGLSQRPLGFKPARYFASLGRKKLPNALHETVELDAFTAVLLTLLDGDRDPSALTKSMADFMSNGKLTMHENGKVVTSAKKLREHAATGVQQSLRTLGERAFLVG
jgi:methyltransferase-like protein/trans-aconitate methyltransferase